MVLYAINAVSLGSLAYVSKFVPRAIFAGLVRDLYKYAHAVLALRHHFSARVCAYVQNTVCMRKSMHSNWKTLQGYYLTMQASD